MKRRATWILCFVAASLMCLGPCALAQDLTLTSPGDNVMDGIYVGPYTATVGNNASQQIVCDDFADETYINQTWNTTANTFQDIGNTLWGQALGVQKATVLYEEAAWIILQMFSGNYNQTQIGYMSYAIWYLFDAGGTAGNPTGVLAWLGNNNQAILSGLMYWVNLAQTGYLNLTAAQLAEFVIYTPTNCPNGPGTCNAQEFMELVTPEGGAALAYLLLAGVACFGAMYRSKSRRATRAAA